MENQSGAFLIPGYYWLFREGEWIVGHYEGATYKDGTPNSSPWTLTGTEFEFRTDEFERVGPRVVPPGLVSPASTPLPRD